MVRTYKRKTSPTYSKEDLKAALKAVKDKEMKILVASRKFNIPRSTLSTHLKNSEIRIGSGHPTVLSPQEEEEIVLIL